MIESIYLFCNQASRFLKRHVTRQFLVGNHPQMPFRHRPVFGGRLAGHRHLGVFCRIIVYHNHVAFQGAKIRTFSHVAKIIFRDPNPCLVWGAYKSLAFIADKSLAFVAYKSEAFVLGSFFLQSEQQRQVVGEATFVAGTLVGALGTLTRTTAIVGEEMVET